MKRKNPKLKHEDIWYVPRAVPHYGNAESLLTLNSTMATTINLQFMCKVIFSQYLGKLHITCKEKI